MPEVRNSGRIMEAERVRYGVVVYRKNNGKNRGKPEYSEVLVSRENVLVKIPRENPYSSYVPGHCFRGEWIPPHFEHRGNINKKLVQRNVFNCGPEDEGRWRVADVKAREKTTRGGHKVALLDITLRPDLDPKEAPFKLKFEESAPEVPITSEIGVTFEKR